MISYYDEQHESQIVYTHLPHGVNEAVCPNPDGTYTIIISTDICEQKQKDALCHAIRHITNGDFWKGNVRRIEAENHKKRWPLESTKNP